MGFLDIFKREKGQYYMFKCSSCGYSKKYKRTGYVTQIDSECPKCGNKW